jgi:transposase InsO family protein
MHLKTQGKLHKAIHIDQGTEFLNKQLEPWCREQGIEIQMTAPYSPSQNGVAERMNHILVELACTMITGQDLLEFLWELAVAHATYICNRSYTKHLKMSTPYEIWLKKKPNVAHLQEFRAPVWVLLQGQKKTRKILPKSQQRAYIRFEDGSNSIASFVALGGAFSS